MLIELEKIGPVAIEKREVGGHNDLLRPDPPPRGDRLHALQPEHRGVLTDPQSPGQPGEKFQRMKLGLIGKPHCPRRGKGEGQFRDKGGLIAQPVQGPELVVDGLPVFQRIDVGRL